MALNADLVKQMTYKMHTCTSLTVLVIINIRLGLVRSVSGYGEEVGKFSYGARAQVT